MTELREQVAREAAAAQGAVGALTDDGVARALELAAALVGERHDAIAQANAADVAAAELDEGALDRLRLDDARIAALGVQLAELAALPPLEREDELGARERPARLPAPDSDRRRRRELRGAAERRRRRRRPVAEEPERRGAAHGRRRAAHGHRARRRGAASCARRRRPAAGGRRASCARRTARARACSSRCRTCCRS